MTQVVPEDPALALPVDLVTAPVAESLPAGAGEGSHLLVLADDVVVEEVEALALSLDLQAGWTGAGRLQLMPGADLLGPWPLGEGDRERLGLPAWAAQVMALDCPVVRSGPLSEVLAGVDPLMDAFAEALPTGVELDAVDRLRLIARRLAGGVRVAPGGVLVVPDPERSTMLTVYSPVWLAPDAAEVVLSPIVPDLVNELDVVADVPVVTGAVPVVEREPEEVAQVVEVVGAEVMDAAWRRVRGVLEAHAAAAAADGVVEEVLDGYGLVLPLDSARPGWGELELRVRGVEGLPLAVLGEPWATGEGVVRYVLTWHPVDPADAYAESLSRARRRERAAARELIEEAASALLRVVGGVVVDDAGFLVALD